MVTRNVSNNLATKNCQQEERMCQLFGSVQANIMTMLFFLILQPKPEGNEYMDGSSNIFEFLQSWNP